jgi:hypothetical protein
MLFASKLDQEDEEIVAIMLKPIAHEVLMTKEY